MGRYVPVVCVAVLTAWAGSAAEHRVPDDFTTLGDALKAATAGDVVRLAAGMYDEQFAIPPGVTLKGDEAGGAIVQGSVKQGVLLTLDGIEGVVVEDVTFRHTDREDPNVKRQWPDLAIVTGGSATFRRCTFQQSGGCGIVGKGGVQLELDVCRFLENVQNGVLAKEEGTVVRISGGEFVKNQYEGIGFTGGASGVVADVTSRENGRNGIMLFNAPGDSELRGNTCSDNAQFGILLMGKSHARIEENVARGNTRGGIAVTKSSQASVVRNTAENNGAVGISVWSVGTEAELESNVLRENGTWGIWFCYGATGTARGNECMGNKVGGIVVSQWDTDAALDGNTCIDNGDTGIQFCGGGKGVAQGNTCRGNARYGLVVMDEGTNPTLGDNTCEGNGIDQFGRSDGLPIERQDQMGERDVGAMLCTRHFDELEALADALREHRSRFVGGAWQLVWFYDSLVSKSTMLNWRAGEDFDKAIQEWLTAYPDSATARIASGKAYIARAWEARGGDWGSNVTEEGWKGFRRNLEKAEKLLNEARKMPDKDPEAYKELITVGMGLDYPEADMDALVAEGATVDATYFPMYWARGYSLLPRWHGGPDDLENFIDRTAADTREEMGEQFYALLVVTAAQWLNQKDIEAGRFCVWKRVNQGCEELRAAFPESPYYLSAHAWLACLYGKRATAKELLDKIGDNVDLSVFGDRSKWHAWKIWAEGMSHAPDQMAGRESKGDRVLPLSRWAKMGRYAFSGVLGGIFLIAFAVGVGLGVRRKRTRGKRPGSGSKPPPLPGARP